MSTCTHPRAITKRYVGSTDTYQTCPDCWEVFGGEETRTKRRLIGAAARANVTEMDEVFGVVDLRSRRA